MSKNYTRMSKFKLVKHNINNIRTKKQDNHNSVRDENVVSRLHYSAA